MDDLHCNHKKKKKKGNKYYFFPYGRSPLQLQLHKNNTSQTDVAPWCYKWLDGIGLEGIQVG